MPGTAQIFPVVGSGVTFPNPMPTQDVADGTPGAVPPSLAIQIAGTDGTDLRVIKTDTVGNVQTHAALLDSDLISTGTINANGANVAIATNGAGAVVFNVTGTWSGTLQPQYQLADGSWVNGSVFPTLPSGVVVSTITANGQWKTLVGGFKAFRLLSTSWASGTATISLEASARQTDIQATIKGGNGASIDAAPGSTAPTNAVQVGGVDYLGNAQAVSTDVLGRPQTVGVNPQPPVIVQGQLGSALTNTTVAGTSCAKAYGSPVKVGNTLVVVASMGVVQAMSISDSVGYQWQCANLGSNASVGITFIFFARVTKAGTPTVTTTFASTDAAMAIYEVEGAGDVDPLGAGAGSTSAATVSVTCPTQQSFGLSFAAFASVASGTISAASPVQPANEVFDTGNIAIAGASVLRNFGVFSASLVPVIQSNGNATTANSTNFQAAIGSAVASAVVSCTFRPMQMQVRLAGQVEVLAGTGAQGVVLPVAQLHSSGVVDASATSNCEYQFNVLGVGNVFPTTGVMVFNGITYDRLRAAQIPNTNAASGVQNTQPGVPSVGVLTGPAGAIVQQISAKSTGSVATLTAATPDIPATGNTIIVVCAVGNSTAPTITDNNTVGTTYKQVAGQLGPANAFGVYVFQGVYTKTNSGVLTVTVHNGGTTASIAVTVYEVAGLLAISQQQPDATSTNSGTSTTAAANAVLPAYANEIAFAGVALGTANQTITPATGWVNDSGQQTPTTPAGLFSFISMSQFLPDFQEVTPQATFTSEPWAIACATFRPIGVTVAGKVSLNGGLYTLQPSQVSGVANATTTRASLTGLGSFENLDILINITGAGSVTGVLQLFIQDSADGGTTWDDLVSSLTFTFGAALVTQRFFVTGDVVSATITTAASTNTTQGSAVSVEALAAGSARQGPWGDRLRVREKVSGVSGSPAGVTYTITLVAKHG